MNKELIEKTIQKLQQAIDDYYNALEQTAEEHQKRLRETVYSARDAVGCKWCIPGACDNVIYGKASIGDLGELGAAIGMYSNEAYEVAKTEISVFLDFKCRADGTIDTLFEKCVTINYCPFCGRDLSGGRNANDT